MYRFKNEAYNFIMVGGDCIVEEENCSGSGECVVFKTESGDDLERINKEKLISGSDYFKVVL